MSRPVRIVETLLVACVMAALCALWPAATAQAAPEKCRKEIWPEAWKFYGDKDAKTLNCDDYEYRLVDLNDDGEDELLVYKRSIACPFGGACTHELWGRAGGVAKRLATLPGRVEVAKTRTEGWLDLIVRTQQAERLEFAWAGEAYRQKPTMKKPVEMKEENPDDPWSSLP